MITTWQEDIASTARYQEPYRRTRSAYLMELRDVDDFAVYGQECDCDGWYDVYSRPSDRLVMRAKGCGLDEAQKIVRSWYPKIEDQEW